MQPSVSFRVCDPQLQCYHQSSFFFNDMRRSFNVNVTNSSFWQSELGNELARGFDFALLWYYDHAESAFRVSLRSEPGTADVGAIAKMFGGGGHVNGEKHSFTTSQRQLLPFCNDQQQPALSFGKAIRSRISSPSLLLLCLPSSPPFSIICLHDPVRLPSHPHWTPPLTEVKRMALIPRKLPVLPPLYFGFFFFFSPHLILCFFFI